MSSVECIYREWANNANPAEHDLAHLVYVESITENKWRSQIEERVADWVGA